MEEKIKKFFAWAAYLAIDRGYVDLEEVCNLFEVVNPFRNYMRDEKQIEQECEEIWGRLEEEFIKFFGMTYEETYMES